MDQITRDRKTVQQALIHERDLSMTMRPSSSPQPKKFKATPKF